MATLAYTFGTGLVAAAIVVWILVWLLVADWRWKWRFSDNAFAARPPRRA